MLVVCSAIELRGLLSRPPAPLTFKGFDENIEENGGGQSPSCTGPPDAEGAPTDLFKGKFTTPTFAPQYRDRDIGVSLLIRRVPPESRAEVIRLLTDPAECLPQEYDPANFNPAIPQTQSWETEFPADLGDAARLVRSVDYNLGDDKPLAVLDGAQVIAVSGAWVISAVSQTWLPAPSADPSEEGPPEESQDPRDPDGVHSALALPGLIRTVLKPFDDAVGTTFAAPPDPAKPCTGEALGEDDLRNLTGPGLMLAVLVHDAGCRNDADWFINYLSETYFVDGELRAGIDAHTTDGRHVPDLPRLAEAIEAGPVPSAGRRPIFAARGWTFALEPRFPGLSGYTGHSGRCGTAPAGSDAICEAAQNRGVVGLDWEPPGMAAGCDRDHFDIRQRLYLNHRSANVPDLAVRSACLSVSTGNRPYDVTVLDGQRSAGDRAQVLSQLVTEREGLVVGPLTSANRTLFIPVEGTLNGSNRWELITVGVEWRGSSYEVVSRQMG